MPELGMVKMPDTYNRLKKIRKTGERIMWGLISENYASKRQVLPKVMDVTRGYLKCPADLE